MGDYENVIMQMLPEYTGAQNNLNSDRTYAEDMHSYGFQNGIRSTICSLYSKSDSTVKADFEKAMAEEAKKNMDEYFEGLRERLRILEQYIDETESDADE